jgi:hypothetical protein
MSLKLVARKFVIGRLYGVFRKFEAIGEFCYTAKYEKTFKGGKVLANRISHLRCWTFLFFFLTSDVPLLRRALDVIYSKDCADVASLTLLAVWTRASGGDVSSKRQHC